MQHLCWRVLLAFEQAVEVLTVGLRGKKRKRTEKKRLICNWNFLITAVLFAEFRVFVDSVSDSGKEELKRKQAMKILVIGLGG